MPVLLRCPDRQECLSYHGSRRGPKLIAAVLAIAVLLVIGPALSAREPAKSASQNPEAQKLIDQAWAALEEKMGPAELDAAIKDLEAAAKLDPKNDGILVELANACFHRGGLAPNQTDADQAARRACFEKGGQAAEKALAIKPGAGAHFWAAANLGSIHENDSVITQASVFPKIKEHLDWIAANDRAYLYGARARFWIGVLTRSNSMLIKMVGEEPKLIYEELLGRIKAEPGYLENYVSQAEYLHSLGNDPAALDALQVALGADPKALPGQVARNRLAQDQAKGRWKQWTGKDHPAR